MSATASRKRSITRSGLSSRAICWPSHHMRCRTRRASSSSLVRLAIACSSLALSRRSLSTSLASSAAARFSRERNHQPTSVMTPAIAARLNSSTMTAPRTCRAKRSSSAVPATTQPSCAMMTMRVTVDPSEPSRRIELKKEESGRYGVSRTVYPARAELCQKFVQQRVKVVHSGLTRRRVASPVIDARTQVALHRLADLDVLILDLVAEPYETLPRRVVRGVFRRMGGEPLEHDEGAIVRQREHRVRLHLPEIDVEHDVRKEPGVHRLGNRGLVRVVLAIRCARGGQRP